MVLTQLGGHITECLGAQVAYMKEPLIPSCNVIFYSLICELWILVTLTDPFKDILLHIILAY